MPLHPYRHVSLNDINAVDITLQDLFKVIFRKYSNVFVGKHKEDVLAGAHRGKSTTVRKNRVEVPEYRFIKNEQLAMVKWPQFTWQ